MLQECGYYDDRHGVGTRVQLTKDTSYTCPSDGYFRIWCAAERGSWCEGMVEGASLMAVSSTNSSLGYGVQHYQMSAVFVRRGASLKYTGSADSGGTATCNGYFYPLA